MIYHVTYNKDGSVHACEEVGLAFENGRYHVYVEAPNKAEALKLAQQSWRAWRNRFAVLAKEKGLCSNCRSRQPPPGYAYCDACRKRCSENQKKKRASTPEQWEQHKKESAARSKVSLVAAAARGRATLQNMRGMARDPRLATLKQCLHVYDRDPGAFRLWLVSTISELETKTGTAAE